MYNFCMSSEGYNRKETELRFATINEKLDANTTLTKQVLEQAIKTNGRVNKLERNLVVVAAILATTLVLKYEQALTVIKLFT